MEGSPASPDRRWMILVGFAAVAAIVVGAILIGRSGGDDEDSTSAGAEGCEQVAKPKPRRVSLAKPKQTVAKGEEVSVVIETSCGDFTIALDTKRAPKTANSFAFLVESGFYDGLAFHRIVPDFVIQGGDPLGNGTGGPGYTVEEKPPANLAYTKGVVAMAKSEAEPPGTSASQFYVVTAADAGLPPEYALVGEVSEGMDVVERIGKLGTPAQKPKQTIVIEKAEIERQ
jgi:peptidyl-prolyl cis-trans isomerase B (cyclophilin B)